MLVPTPDVQQRNGRPVRWGLGVGLAVSVALSVVGGLVQHAPQSWNVPVGQWRFYSDVYTYWFYPWSEQWALVIVPVFLAKALPVAVLAGVYAGLVIASRARGGCCAPRRGGGLVAMAGLGFGAGGMLACCSLIALLVVGVGGFGAAALLMDHGLWMGTVGMGAAVAWQARMLLGGRQAATTDRERHVDVR